MVKPNELHKDHITLEICGEYVLKGITRKKQIITKETFWKKDVAKIAEFVDNKLQIVKNKCLVYLYQDPQPMVVKGSYEEHYRIIYGEDVHKNPSIIEVKGFKNENANTNTKKNKKF